MEPYEIALLVIACVAGAAAIFWCVINLIKPAKTCKNNPFIFGKTLISAHRGGSKINPENTERAFDHVILETDYSDIVEIDIRKTKDNILVICHDDHIDRTGILREDLSEKPSRTVKINEHNLSDLENYNLGVNFVNLDGERPYKNLSIQEAKDEKLTIMTFERFLEKYKNKREFRLYLEIKENEGENVYDLVDDIIEILNKEENLWWKNHTTIIAFNTDIVRYIYAKYTDFLIGALGHIMVPQFVNHMFGLDIFSKPTYHGVQTQMKNKKGCITMNMATRKFIKSCHNRNQTVTFWTINDAKNMKKCLAVRPDAITTDNPKLLSEIMKK